MYLALDPVSYFEVLGQKTLPQYCSLEKNSSKPKHILVIGSHLSFLKKLLSSIT